MPGNFDPYHAWLGIPSGARPVNYYQLLGLGLFESEPPVIAEAAEERTEKVQRFSTGEHAAEALRILDELRVARQTLLSAQTRRTYDAELRRVMGLEAPAEKKAPARAAVAAPSRPAAAPPHAAAPPAAAMLPPTAPVAAAAVPRAAQPMPGVAVPIAPQAMPVGAMPAQAVPVAPVAAAAMSALPVGAVPVGGLPVAAAAMPVGAIPSGVPVAGVAQGIPVGGPSSLELQMPSMGRRFRRRNQSSGTVALIGVALALLVLLGAVCFAYRDSLLAALNDQPPQTISAEDEMQALANAAKQRQYQQRITRNLAKLEQPTTPSPRSASEAPRRTTPADHMASMVAADQDTMTGDRRAPEKTAPQPKKAVSQPSLIALPSLRKPATSEESAAVAKSLANARAALGDRNWAKAREQMNLALVESASPDSMAAVDRMQTLDKAVHGFWDAVKAAVADLKPVDELSYSGKKAVVVNVEPDQLGLRIEGQNREYKLDKLPGDLALHLAEQQLKPGDPTTKIYLGAFLAVEPKGDRSRALQLWQEAADEGADTAKLLIDLDKQLADSAKK